MFSLSKRELFAGALALGLAGALTAKTAAPPEPIDERVRTLVIHSAAPV